MPILLLQEVDLDGAGYREGSGLPGRAQVCTSGCSLQKLLRHGQDSHIIYTANAYFNNRCFHKFFLSLDIVRDLILL
jgi:hypothetical protein